MNLNFIFAKKFNEGCINEGWSLFNFQLTYMKSGILALTRILISQYIHLIPEQKLCCSCPVVIQKMISKENSGKNNDECNIDGDDDSMNNVERNLYYLGAKKLT